jgi:hypothetical protein
MEPVEVVEIVNPMEPPPAPAWLDAALATLGLPAAESSMLVVFCVAAVVVRLNQDLKLMARRGQKDTLAWQMLWRALPFAQGALLGLLPAALGAVGYLQGVVLGLVGGGFAVPLWHVLRARMPGLFGR